MASLKNKITHRKRKNGKNQQQSPAQQPEKLAENNKATTESPTCNSHNKSKTPSFESLPRKAANGVTRKNSSADAKCKKTATGVNSPKGNGSMRRSKNEPVPAGPDLIRDLKQPRPTTDAVGGDVTDCAAVHAHGSRFLQLIAVLQDVALAHESTHFSLILWASAINFSDSTGCSV